MVCLKKALQDAQCAACARRADLAWAWGASRWVAYHGLPRARQSRGRCRTTAGCGRRPGCWSRLAALPLALAPFGVSP